MPRQDVSTLAKIWAHEDNTGNNTGLFSKNKIRQNILVNLIEQAQLFSIIAKESGNPKLAQAYTHEMKRFAEILSKIQAVARSQKLP